MKRIVIVIAIVTLFGTPLLAQVNRMVGPYFPILIDTNGDGLPSEDIDTPVIPTIDTSLGVMHIPNPLDSCTFCGGASFLTLEPPGGPYAGFTRFNGTERQSIMVGALSGGRPVSFRMEIEKGGVLRNGVGQLLDQDGNGVMDGLRGSSTALNFTVNFLQADVDGNGIGDYISMPWSQSSIAGVPNGFPPIWIPLADSNGDGQPDTILLDLDGNGVADPNYVMPPVLGPAAATAGLNAVPALGSWGFTALTFGILGVALAMIRKGALPIGI